MDQCLSCLEQETEGVCHRTIAVIAFFLHQSIEKTAIVENLKHGTQNSHSGDRYDDSLYLEAATVAPGGRNCQQPNYRPRRTSDPSRPCAWKHRSLWNKSKISENTLARLRKKIELKQRKGLRLVGAKIKYQREKLKKQGTETADSCTAPIY